MPLPKLYGDEDTSDSEGLELADGTTVGKKATGGAGNLGGGGMRNHPPVVVVPVQVAAEAAHAVVAVPVQAVAAAPVQVAAGA